MSTAFAAFVAIFISIKQIRTSNKQALFERRLRLYMTVKWMKSLCDKHRPLKDEYMNDIEKRPIISINYLFNLMTNNASLESLQGLLNNVSDKDYQRVFLLKMGELRNMCEEARLIFPTNIVYPIADFIYYYEEMLVSMYKYQKEINSIKKAGEEYLRNSNLVIQKCEIMKNFLNGTFELAEQIGTQGSLDKIAKTIKL